MKSGIRSLGVEVARAGGDVEAYPTATSWEAYAQWLVIRDGDEVTLAMYRNEDVVRVNYIGALQN